LGIEWREDLFQVAAAERRIQAANDVEILLLAHFRPP
jgi:hypothetical protein